MATLNELTLRLKVVTRDLERGMDRAEDAVDDFADKTRKASASAEQSIERVEVAVDEAESEVQELGRAVDKVDGKDIDIDVNRGGIGSRSLSAITEASRRVSEFSRALGVLGKRIPVVAAGVGTLTGALATAASGMAAATTASAGLTAALGGVVGGLGAVGVKAAAMEEEVKSAFSGLKSAAKEGMRVLTRPIQSVLTGLAPRLADVFAQIAPGLEAIFADIAEYVRAFADALLPVVDRVMPSFVSLVNSARPVVDSFAQGLASLGPTLTNALGSIESAVPAIQSMVDRLFQSLNKLIPYIAELSAELAKMGGPSLDAFFDTLEWAVTTFGEFVKSITALANFLVRDVELSFDYLKAQAKSLATAFRGLIPDSQGSNPFSHVREGAGKAATSVQDLAEKSEAYQDILRSVIETSGEEPFSLTSKQAQKALPKVQERIQKLEEQGLTTIPAPVAGAEGAQEAQAKAAENYRRKLERLKKVQAALTKRAQEGEAATSSLSKEMKSFLEKLRGNPLSAFNEGLSKTEKVMKGLSDRLERIKFEGKLAKARGEFDRIEQMESRLRALGKAFKEAADAKGEDSQKAQELFKRYQKLAEQLRIFKGEAEDVKGGVMPEVPAYDPGSDLPKGTLNLDVELNLDQAKLAIDALKGKLKTALGTAVSSASRRFGQEFSDAIWSAFSGPDEGRIASLEERRLDLKQELENLDRREMAHERYAARVKAIHAELAETNRQLAHETSGVFERVFRGIGNMVKSVIKQVIAEITAAIAKAAVLKAISAAITGGAGAPFGAIFRNGVSALFGGGTGPTTTKGALATTSSISPSTPIPAQATPTGALTVNLQGEFRQRGQDLVATINTTQNANTRRGRSG